MNGFKELYNRIQETFFNKSFSTNGFNQSFDTIKKEYENFCENSAEGEKFDYYSRFYNKFFGEIKPLSILVNNIQCDRITIGDEQSRFDAEIEVGIGKRSIECVFAIEGYYTKMAFDHLKEYKMLYPCSNLEYNDKTKASGDQKIKEQSRPNVETVRETKSRIKTLIQGTINNKIEKSGKKDSEALLLTTFFLERLSFRADNEIKEMMNDIEIGNHFFQKACLVGQRGCSGSHFFYMK